MERQPVLFVRVKDSKKARLLNGKLQILVDDSADSNEKGSSVSSKDNGNSKFIPEVEYLKQLSGSSSGSGSNSLGSTPNSNTCCHHHTTCASMAAAATANTSTQSLLSKNDNNMTTSTNMTEDNNLDIGKIEESLNSMEYFEQVLDSKTPLVDLFTHKGVYLSSACSCEDGNCPCLNCLIHRNEDELNSYIRQSGIPLTNVGEAEYKNELMECTTSNCACTAVDCLCQDCIVHPTEIISIDKILLNGLLHMTLRRKTVIKFKNKLIPSQYWWDFLIGKTVKLQEGDLESIDIIGWFDSLINKYPMELLDASDMESNNYHQRFYVI